jgi:hypothetical protein
MLRRLRPKICVTIVTRVFPEFGTFRVADKQINEIMAFLLNYFTEYIYCHEGVQTFLKAMRPVYTNEIQFQSSVRALCFEMSEADFLIHLIFLFFSIHRLMICSPESLCRKTLVLYDFLSHVYYTPTCFMALDLITLIIFGNM